MTPELSSKATERNRPGSRRRNQKGATMVELSLTILPTLALLLAILDFTLPVFMNTLFDHAVRTGVRYAITYRTRSGMSHAQSIKQVVQENAAGFLSGTEGLSKINVKYYSPVTFTEVTGINANVGGNIVEVSIDGFQWNWIAPVWRPGTPLSITARSADRLESLPRGVARPQP